MNKKTFTIPKNTNSGIYMLYNLNIHKAYIGATHNFSARARNHRHLLMSDKHSNKLLQVDFNNGNEFVFVVLEDMGNNCENSLLFFREKQYIYAFREKRINHYNTETTEQLKDTLFFSMVSPTITEIQNNLQKQFACPITSLARCSDNTLKEKFSQSMESERAKNIK